MSNVIVTETPIVIEDNSGVTVLTASAQGPQGPAGAGGTGGAVTYSSENKDSVSLTIGAPLAVHTSGIGVIRANATDNSKHCVGLATVGVAVGAAETVLTAGPLTKADWTSVIGTTELVAKATYYLSASAGLLTNTPPSSGGNVVQAVGQAVSTTTLNIQIEPAILL